MVCLGNICRSPMAQGLLENKLEHLGLSWEVDSAGTSGYHDGELPDHRAIKTCEKRGINISNQRSRKITPNDLQYFDHILAMDSSNFQDIIKLCTTSYQKSKVELLSNFRFAGMNKAVPDPYYNDRFDEVFDLIDGFLEGLINVNAN